MAADPVALKMLLVQTAGCVIHCLDVSPPKEYDNPIAGPGKVIADRVRWASHGYVNALQEQVAFLYGFVEWCVRENGIPIGPAFVGDRGEINLILEALERWQVAKTAVVKQQQAAHGANFGSATGFVQMDWTDQNEKFRALFMST